MIHYITLPKLICEDYKKRGVFQRYHDYPGDVRAKLSTDDLKAILTDADAHSEMGAETFPNLVIAYNELVIKARNYLRSVPGNLNVGRDNKSAAAGKDD